MAESYKPEITLELLSNEIDDVQKNLDTVATRIKAIINEGVPDKTPPK